MPLFPCSSLTDGNPGSGALGAVATPCCCSTPLLAWLTRTSGTGTFTERTTIGDDLEVIPSFSHTSGTTLYLWDNGEHRFLFTGDAIWVEDGVWQAAVLGESDRHAFVDTLTLLRDLDFDVLVPWPAQRGALPYDVVTPEQKQEQIDQLIVRI
ncbi:MAG: hypothetical protein ACTH1D_00450 [Mycobacteriaceae bacterium]